MANGTDTPTPPSVDAVVQQPRQPGRTITAVSGDLAGIPTSGRPIYPGAKPEEIATLIVDGLIYEDWENVWIHWSLGEPWAQFRFTATEEVYETLGTPQIDPVTGVAGKTWRSLAQFAPGDEFECLLGGQPVMSGVILVRQVAYDAKSHTVVLQGVSLSWYAARASILDEKSEFEGSFLAIAGKVLAPTCSTYKVIGSISGKPYEVPQRPSPGETIFQFLERIGRDKNVMVVSDPYGDFVFIGDHNGEVVADLLEGENILKMQAIIKDLEPYSEYVVRAHRDGNDQTNMGAAAQIESRRGGTAKCYSPHLVPIEHPATKEETDLRANHEYDFNEKIVEANITVQGWFNPLSGLRWDVGQDVYVKSPMAMLDMLMKIEACTWTQDNRGGSLTVLKCVAPWNWNDNNFQIGPNNHEIIQPPQPAAKSTPTDAPATTPPEQQPHSER